MNSNVVCIELAPGTDPRWLPGYAAGSTLCAESEDGWRMFPFTSPKKIHDCVALLVHDSPDAVFIFDGYEDPNVAGFFHGTDCALSLWVARGGVDDTPNCQRLAAGGSFHTFVLPAPVE